MPGKSGVLYLKQVPVGPMENFAYLIGDQRQRECVIVDPAWDLPALLGIARKDGMRITAGLLTHGHHDHANAAAALIEKTGCKIYAHRKEAPFLDNIRNALVPVESGRKISAGDIEITCLHTPGHTPGSLCFLAQDQLISGDTLFVGACGRVDLPGGSAEEMYESLQGLQKLGEHVILLPGHHYGPTPTSTLGNEKRTNPYYQCGSLSDFLRLRLGG